MSYDVFGDLQEWGRVLDQVQRMRQDEVLDNHQRGLARLARYPFNWRLRQAALRATAELKRPTDEILQIAVQIMADDNSDLETRILAGNAVNEVLGNGGGASISDSAHSRAAKSIQDLLDTPQPPVLHTHARQWWASLHPAAKATTTMQ